MFFAALYSLSCILIHPYNILLTRRAIPQPGENPLLSSGSSVGLADATRKPDDDYGLKDRTAMGFSTSGVGLGGRGKRA
jgi:hypothetical protein